MIKIKTVRKIKIKLTKSKIVMKKLRYVNQ